MPGLLDLERPLAFFDLETTGLDPATDRIVEIAVLRLDPGGGRDSRCRRINPERPIPPQATAVHGIRDADVRDAPTFRQVARGLLEFVGPADLAGYNIARFDVPLLARELRDAGHDLDLARRRVIDAMTIFHRHEPRDLRGAVAFYLGRDHAGAHSAETDVVATAEVLEAQLARYAGLPRDVAGLARWLAPAGPPVVDRAGRFVWRDGEAVLAFGKHRDKRLRDVAADERDYLQWIVEQPDFPAEAREVVGRALAGEFPQPATDQST